MKICSLQIENFGKLHRYSRDFSDGLNTVCEENGWGKSTLAAFIKAMFYGLPRNRVQSLDDNERKKFTPWQGGTFGGNLVFECTRGKFRVERTFGDVDEFRLVDLASGLPSHAYSEDLGRELFGIDADGFERSTFLSARLLAPDNGNSTLNAKLTGVLEEVHDMGNFDRAFRILDDRAKEYKKSGGRGRIGEIDGMIRARNEELRERKRLLSDLKAQQEAHDALLREVEQATADSAAAQQAEVRAGLTESRRRLEQELERLKAQKADLEARYEGPLPEAPEIAGQRALLREIEVGLAGVRALGPDENERAELVRLSAAFPTGVPSDEILEQRSAEAVSLRNDRIRHAAERENAEQSRQNAQTRLRSLPDPDAVRAALDRLEPAGAPPTPKFLFIAAVVLALGGIAGLVAGILLKNLPAVIAGGAALVASLLCPAFGALFGRGKKERTANAREAGKTARDLLKQAGRPTDGDLFSALRSLLEEIDRAENDLAEAEKKWEQLQPAGAALREREAGLRAFLAGYGTVGNDPETDLNRLKENAKTYTRLLRKEKDAERLRAERQADLREKTEAVDRFLARRKEHPAGLDREGLIDLFAQETERAATLAGQIAERSEALRQLIAEKKLDEIAPGGPLEDPAALTARRRALDDRLQGLRAKEKELALSVDRLLRETEPIPEIAEELDRLKEEQKDLNERYRLVVATRDLLTAARDGLTTRYLDGTRRNFAKYLSLLAGADAPDAEVDAAFRVTVLDGGMSRVLNAYSRGWRDILQFCVRLAVVDELFNGSEAPFLLLDDPFTNLDERRLAFAKNLLATLTDRYQILYLVCHGDRA